MANPKMSVVRVYETGMECEVGSGLSEKAATKLAVEEAEIARREGDSLVFVRWYRASDGQAGYLNRDGHSPTGRAW